jgi:hypothetical protein
MLIFSFILLLSFGNYSSLFYLKHGVSETVLNNCINIPTSRNFLSDLILCRPPLWSSGQRSCLQIQRSRVRFQALQDFLRSSGSETECTQLREDI